MSSFSKSLNSSKYIYNKPISMTAMINPWRFLQGYIEKLINSCRWLEFFTNYYTMPFKCIFFFLKNYLKDYKEESKRNKVPFQSYRTCMTLEQRANIMHGEKFNYHANQIRSVIEVRYYDVHYVTPHLKQRHILEQKSTSFSDIFDYHQRHIYLIKLCGLKIFFNLAYSVMYWHFFLF